MAFTKAFDVSVYQGHINFAAVKAAGYDIALIKVSGGDGPNGDYVDGLAGEHYNGARAAGLAVGTYHFAGENPGASDPVTQANYFVQVCTPLDENQVLILDFDSDEANAVDWVNTFTHEVHQKCGVWPIVYVNGSTRNAHDWTPVAANCGFWIAWYGKDPNQDLPVNGVYIIHQYSDTGSIPGIAGNVDLDAVYMSVEVFNKYGYHAPVATPVATPVAPAPAPTPPPAPTPVPTPIIAPTPAPVVTVTPPAPTQVTVSVPVPPVPQTNTTNTNTPIEPDKASTLSSNNQDTSVKPLNWWQLFLNFLKKLIV